MTSLTNRASLIERLEEALDELFYWHDQCMTRNNVSGPDSASFRSAWRELGIRVIRAEALRKAFPNDHRD